MPNTCIWTAAFGLLFVVSMIGRNEALTPFQLTYLPVHVVRHVTKLVTVRCAHDNTVSQLAEISRIRLLKKSPSGWQLLAELRDFEDKPKAYINVSVSARISSNIRENFMEIVWPVATEATFGTYRCDVIGFDTLLHMAEVTSEITLLEEHVTTFDMLDMLIETKDEMHHMLDMFIETKDEMHRIENGTQHLAGDVRALNNKLNNISQLVQVQSEDVSRLEDDMDTVRQSVSVVTGDVALLKGKVSSLESKTIVVSENTSQIDNHNTDLESLKREVGSLMDIIIGPGFNANQFGSLMYWPAGKFALLQPKTGCPIDRTFLGGKDKYWQIHTESSSSSANQNAHSDVLSPKTLSTKNSKYFLTLYFCEANGILNTAPWPSGSYCINKIKDEPCPADFSEGRVQVDNEDSNQVKDFTSRSVESQDIYFCCMSSGNVTTSIKLPTQSPFLLYRRGGRCQQVSGMTVSEESITIDTEDSSNIDSKHDSCPDIDLSAGSTMKIELCHYTKT